MIDIPQRIAEELGVAPKQVMAAIGLLDEGATVPFISRYRKEATGALDDTQMRILADRLGYLRELEDRRLVILTSIEEQGKLTAELRVLINQADTKTRLEDLYLPYKQKRRTRAQIAIEAGIELLADSLLNNPMLNPQLEAAAFINADPEFKDAFIDTKGVLDGARQILMERFAENAELLAQLRSYLADRAQLTASLIDGKEQEAAKFRDYFEHKDITSRVPSHRALAMFRGRKANFLQLKIDVEHDETLMHPCMSMIATHFNIIDSGRPADAWLAEVVRFTWRVKLHLHLETEFMSELRARAEETAIEVFARNIKELLLAAPAGQKATIGLDPGLRTGVKIAVISNTGQFLDSTAIYPHAPRNQWDESIAVLAKLAKQYEIELLAIGNGTASRETDRLCGELIKRHPELRLQKILVSEAGASIYSASELAAKEFPDLDVTIRGAVSIARRLQDPLAELVKIEPKSIGVGQYQHDVSQVQLARHLDAVVEDCVNAVGVEVNTASAALLRRVAGLSQSIADNIVDYRNTHGQFSSREQLKSVPRLGDKTFEQAAGFLRVHNGSNPLDRSAVHPEAYSVVELIAKKTGHQVKELIGNRALKDIDARDFTSDHFGLFTVRDIIAELEKPGRDPRPEFKAARFQDGVETLKDLEHGMILEGTVTNVTNFGAFVDIGVHQDGLVHISALANSFVKDPHDVVKAGEIVKVRVLEVDLDRKRIALTMRLSDEPAAKRSPDSSTKRSKPNQEPAPQNARSGTSPRPAKPAAAPINNAFAHALRKAQEKADKPG
jgi:protein Tex